MKQLTQKIVIVLAPAFVYLIGQYFRGVWFMNTSISPCGHAEDANGPFCNSPYLDTLGWPLIQIGTILFLVSLVVLVSNDRGFKLWKRFSYFALPAAVALFFLVHISFPYGSFLFIDPLRIIDFIGYWLYLPLSVLIVLYAYLPRRK